MSNNFGDDKKGGESDKAEDESKKKLAEEKKQIEELKPPQEFKQEYSLPVIDILDPEEKLKETKEAKETIKPEETPVKPLDKSVTPEEKKSPEDIKLENKKESTEPPEETKVEANEESKIETKEEPKIEMKEESKIETKEVPKVETKVETKQEPTTTQTSKPHLSLVTEEKVGSETKDSPSKFDKKQFKAEILKMLKEYQEKTLSNLQANDKKYILPPLLFFSSFYNVKAFELIKAEIEFFKKIGYSRIAMEYDHNKPLADIIEEQELSISMLEAQKEKLSKGSEMQGYIDVLQTYNDQIIKSLIEFLKFIPTSGLSYMGIDAPLDKYRDPDHFDLIMYSNKINQAREKCSAAIMASEVSASQGGAIIILGYEYKNIQAKLAEIISPKIDHWLFFDFNPVCAEQFMNKGLQIDIEAMNFKYKPQTLDVATDLSLAISALEEAVNKQRNEITLV